MQVTQLALIIIYLISPGQCQVEPYIVDGQDAEISKFPYIAFLSITCVSGHEKIRFVCGSSIVNQHLTLTAAHCTNECTGRTAMTVYVGHAIRYSGASSTVHSYFQHEFYSERNLRNDICLVRLNTPLTLGSKVQRVALMKNPPYDGAAVLAGWGMYDEKASRYPKHLQFATQYVKDKDYCRRRGGIEGTICAAPNEGYAASGDSGSALVVRNYIQIGIVSYTRSWYPNDDHLVFYTDTGYYYQWIEESSITVMCS